MEILVVCGSPKGEYSTTLHTALYLEKRHPEHRFSVIHPGRDIRKMEKDFAPVREAVAKAELLLFVYPVYTFLAPSQLHRFMELMAENGVSLAGKYVSQITTSKHFYDITAHAFIEDCLHDLGADVVHGLSQDMDDLTHPEGRAQADQFFRFLMWNMKHGLHEPQRAAAPAFVPAATHPAEPSAKTLNKRVVILTDAMAEDVSLTNMISRFRAVLPCETDVVNIREFPFKGGCISCFRCAADGTCIWKDGFDRFLREHVQTADAVVTAFSVRGHSMGSLFKVYDDRQFCNGHRTVTMGHPTGYLVSGPISREENLRTMLEARANVGGNFLCGVASDEQAPDAAVDKLAQTLAWALKNDYRQTANFYGVGGMKIFRDLIWMMQGLMRADHRFFKSHGQYDFPQKKRGTMLLMYLAGAAMNNPKLRQKLGPKINEGMVSAYRKAVDEAVPDTEVDE